MSFDSVQSSHTAPGNDGPTATPTFNAHADLIARDYARSPHRPTINTEPPYEDITRDLATTDAAADYPLPGDEYAQPRWSV